MAAAYELDRIGRRIPAALQADGRGTKRALSARAALSSGARLARARSLEPAGIIQGHHARGEPAPASTSPATTDYLLEVVTADS